MSEQWNRYYAAAGQTPRETLLDALDRFDAEGRSPGAAVDLGSGAGRDTLELLRRGWTVVAVDSEPAGLEQLLAHPDAAARSDALRTVVASFEEASWPEADLVNASFSLPFCPPNAFGGVWQRIRSSLRPRGRFAGHLFGDRDGWAGEDGMTFHSRAQVQALLAGYEAERLEESERDGQTALGAAKHWHLFNLVLRKP